MFVFVSDEVESGAGDVGVVFLGECNQCGSCLFFWYWTVGSDEDGFEFAGGVVEDDVHVIIRRVSSLETIR